MEATVRSQHAAGLQKGRSAAQVGNGSTRLGDEQRAGGNIPGEEALLEERREATRRDVGQIESRRTQAPDSRGDTHRGAQHREVGLMGLATVSMGNSRGDESVRKVCVRTDVESHRAEPSARSELRREHLPLGGVKDHSGDRPTVAHERHRNGKMRDAPKKISGSVERVDDEASG